MVRLLPADQMRLLLQKLWCEHTLYVGIVEERHHVRRHTVHMFIAHDVHVAERTGGVHERRIGLRRGAIPVLRRRGCLVRGRACSARRTSGEDGRLWRLEEVLWRKRLGTALMRRRVAALIRVRDRRRLFCGRAVSRRSRGTRRPILVGGFQRNVGHWPCPSVPTHATT